MIPLEFIQLSSPFVDIELEWIILPVGDTILFSVVVSVVVSVVDSVPSCSMFVDGRGTANVDTGDAKATKGSSSLGERIGNDSARSRLACDSACLSMNSQRPGGGFGAIEGGSMSVSKGGSVANLKMLYITLDDRSKSSS